MTELKTLKDIPEDNPECDHKIDDPDICTGCIRKEAIKHIKEIDSDLSHEREMGDWDRTKISGLIATREWIVNFFNITEEDLKDVQQD